MTAIFRSRPSFSLIALIGVSVGILFFTANRLPAQSIPPNAADAIQSEDWVTLANELSGVTRDEPSPVLRLIAGHALLATNRNNASLELFASALDDASLSEWEEWTAAFAGHNPESSAAWYYSGDAQARLQNWEAAIEAFDRALEINPQSFLALNAKGIAHHGVGSSVQARKFIVQSAKINPSFADAHASRAVLGLYRGQSRTERHALAAVAASEDADPAAFLNAQALALFFAKEFDEAKDVFGKIPADSAVGSIAEENVVVAELADIGALDGALRVVNALNQANDLGMSLTALSSNIPELTVSTEKPGEETATTGVFAFKIPGVNFPEGGINIPPDVGPITKIKIGPFEILFGPPPPKPDPPEEPETAENDDEEVDFSDEEKLQSQNNRTSFALFLGPSGLVIGPRFPGFPEEEEYEYPGRDGPIRPPREIFGPLYDNIVASTGVLNGLREAIVTATGPLANSGNLGGVDSLPPVSHVGKVIPVYGLLYSVPLVSVSEGS